MSDVWKKFEENGLTHSSVHHLMAIYDLLKDKGYARGIDVANYLDISRSSVSVTLHKLLAKGFIAEDSNKFFQLTEEGKEITNDVLSIRRIVKMFFSDVLGLPEDIAEEDACKIEHLLNHKTGESLFKLVDYFNSSDPHCVQFREKFKKYNHECSNDCDVCDENCFIIKS
jgi:DtxR family Mn-dependent transcriptional regulator